MKTPSVKMIKNSPSKSLMHFIDNTHQLGEDKTKIFQILDTLIKEPTSLSFDIYLEGAMILLNNAEKNFIKLRSNQLILWIIKHINTKHLGNYSTTNQCDVNTFFHTVSFPFMTKKVLSFFIDMKGVNLDFERVQQTLLLKHPTLSIVDGSIIYITNQRDGTTKIHFEVQREKSLLDHESSVLKKDLSTLVHKYSELNQPQVVVPSNRELLAKSFRWIMRDLDINDIYQVFIDFTQQIGSNFKFSVLVCHILTSEKTPLKTLLVKHPDIHVDSISNYKEGALTKEGAILTVDIQVASYLSIFKARRKCSQLLHSLIGSFRDINGGLLEKIEDNFKRFWRVVPAPLDELSTFFYGIISQEKQATAPISLLKKIYDLFIQQKFSSNEFGYAIHEDEETVCITTKATQISFEKEYRHSLIHNFPNLLITSVLIKDTVIVSCGVQKTDSIDIEKLKETTQKFYHTWLEKKEVKQVLKLGCVSDFISLDPRIGSQEEPSHLLKMLFEGLTRIGPDGTPQNALARKIEISESGLYYRFYLRKSTWSDGTPLTAHDFEYSWKTSLKPNFLSPLSYLFYPIENSQAVKAGSLPSTALGINAIDNLTFEVKLQYPTPYFLDLCSHSTFSPVCQSTDINNPSWPNAKGKSYICNGPFKLHSSSTPKNLILSRNLSYWNKEKVHLEKIIISKTSELEAQTLFDQKELDLILYPFCKKQTSTSFSRTDTIQRAGVLENRYLSLDCMKPPFSSNKLREAFSLAIDRGSIAPHFSVNSIPQYTHYSPVFSQLQANEKKLKTAQKLFSESLIELNYDKDSLHNEKVYTTLSSENGAQNLVLQLNAAFGLTLGVAVVDTSELFRLILNRKINLFLFSWVNRIKDPCYFLETFSTSSGMINYSHWENIELNSLIQSIKNEPSSEIRKSLHLQAEEILQREKPLIPLVSTQMFSTIPHNIQDVIIADSQSFDICFCSKI